MKIVFVTGHEGNVGTELIKRGYEKFNADITDPQQVQEALAIQKITKDDLIINCAAMTDVDWCEANPQEAQKVNAGGVHNLVSYHKGKFIQISTDHIFDGKRWSVDGYRENARTSPLNVYGLTKLAGEVMALNGWPDAKVIRTSKLFNRQLVDKRLGKIYDGKEDYFTSLILRSWLHIKHFVEGLEWIVKHWDACPEILHLSGTVIMSHFAFYRQVCLHDDELDENLVLSRKGKLKDAVSRPFRGGLNVSYAKRLGVPLYNAFDGIRMLNE